MGVGSNPPRLNVATYLEDFAMTDAPGFWSLAHCAVETAESEEDFTTTMQPHKELIGFTPAHEYHFNLVMKNAWRAWHEGTSFPAWSAHR